MKISKKIATVAIAVLAVAGATLATTSATAATALPTSTNLHPQGWSLKPTATDAGWVDGGLKLNASDNVGSSWAIITLPSGTHLSDLGDLTTNFVSKSGQYWGGIILEGGDLTDQLHYDDNGRFWTTQSGIFDTDRAGYYQSWEIDGNGADVPGSWTGISDPLIGTLKIYVNAGQSAVVASQNYIGGTQAFDFEEAVVETPEPSVTPEPTDEPTTEPSEEPTVAPETPDQAPVADPVKGDPSFTG